MAKFTDRMLRAAKLDPNLYEEVEADRNALGQAMAVVVLSSLAAGIGSMGMAGAGGGAILVGMIAALGGWYLWAFLTYLIGTRMLPGPQTSADVGEMLRTIGFSSSPGLLRVFGIIPGLRVALFAITSIWMLVAMVIAVRQALDYESSLRALGVCVIGWIIQALFFMLLFSLFGGSAATPPL